MAGYKFKDTATPSSPSTPFSTTTASMNASVTTLSVAAKTKFPASVQFDVLLDDEYMLVTADAGGLDYTVTRGMYGSTAATHASGADVFHVLTVAGLLGSPGPMTTTGDLPYLSSTGSVARLAAGADGTFLRYASGIPTAGAIQVGDLPSLSSVYQPLDADLTAIAALSSTGGWAKRTGSDTWTISTPTASDVAALSLASPWNLVSGGAAGTYTLANSGVVIKNAGGDELMRLWATDPNTGSSHNALNLYIGSHAGQAQPTADDSGSGYQNNGIGAYALTAITSGAGNNAQGAYALQSVTSGSENTGVGNTAAYSLTEGYQNVAIGSAALYSAVTGHTNTAIGLFSLYYANGHSNVGVGAGALSRVTSGAQNTMVGAVNDTDLFGIGAPDIVTGSQNTVVGFDAGPTSDVSNTLALGAGAIPTASNRAVIGNASVTDVYLGSESALATLHAANVSGTNTGDQDLSSYVTLTGAQSLTNKKLGSLTSNGFVKTSAGDGTLSVDTATYLTSVTAHNLLSTTHGDTLADSVVRGDILYGNSTPKWARLAKPSVLSNLSHDGTDVSWVTSTGTGAPVRATSAVLVTPLLGTPTSGVLTNCTGLPEAGHSFSDVTTGNATSSAHGFMPKLSGNAYDFALGDGTYGRTVARGTITDTSPWTFTQTWNDAADIFRGLVVNITNTASDAASALFAVDLAGSQKFAIGRSGELLGALQIGKTGSQFSVFASNGTNAPLVLASGSAFGWTSSSGDATGTQDVFVRRGGAAATVQLGTDLNGAAISQILQACNGITGTDKTGGNFTLASGKGTGAGAVSSIFLQTPTAIGSSATAQALTTRVTIDVNGIKATGYLSSDGTAGATGGPWTSVTVKNGLVVSGS